MKTLKTLLLVLAMTATYTINAQVAISNDGSSADGSAMLEVKSTDKGFLPPRITDSQKNGISNPAVGLTVWCTDCGTNGEMQVYNGTEWTNMIGGEAAVPPPEVGDYYQGGVVFYIFQSGDPGYIEGETHGLIAAPSDQSTGAEWGCYGTEISGADGTALGTGEQNTIDILNDCSTSGIAAKLCADYSNNGYEDWFLPSIAELNKLYINRVAVGGFAPNFYWSSSEYSSDYAWLQGFNFGIQGSTNKGHPYYVRAVRAF